MSDDALIQYIKDKNNQTDEYENEWKTTEKIIVFHSQVVAAPPNYDGDVYFWVFLPEYSKIFMLFGIDMSAVPFNPLLTMDMIGKRLLQTPEMVDISALDGSPTTAIKTFIENNGIGLVFNGNDYISNHAVYDDYFQFNNTKTTMAEWVDYYVPIWEKKEPNLYFSMINGLNIKKYLYNLSAEPFFKANYYQYQVDQIVEEQNRIDEPDLEDSDNPMTAEDWKGYNDQQSESFMEDNAQQKGAGARGGKGTKYGRGHEEEQGDPQTEYDFELPDIDIITDPRANVSGFKTVVGLNAVQYSGWFLFIPQSTRINQYLTSDLWNVNNRYKNRYVVLKFETGFIANPIYEMSKSAPMVQLKSDRQTERLSMWHYTVLYPIKGKVEYETDTKYASATKQLDDDETMDILIELWKNFYKLHSTKIMVWNFYDISEDFRMRLCGLR